MHFMAISRGHLGCLGIE